MNKVIIALIIALSSPIFLSAQSAKELTQKGREFYEKREFMEALLNLNKAIDADPNYSQAYYVRGNIKDAFDDRHGAMKDYNVAVEKNPKFAEAFSQEEM
jgi:Tfp pilus assembly protein PilF